MTRLHEARRIGVLLLPILILYSLPRLTPAPPEENPGRSFVLENGLRVFLYEKHGLPLVNIAVAVNAGSKDETAETNGFVHLLEHCLLFRGTARRSAAEISHDIRSHGAYYNANTGQDLAVFEISLPAEHADFALRNQKEILFDFGLSQADLDQEKPVVLEEMNQMEDDPQRHGTDLLMQRLFEGHPYGRPVPGRPDVVRAARVEEIEAFHRKYFIPNNCALAVVGDFRIPEMEGKIREIFGSLKRSDFAPPTIPKAGLLAKNVLFQEEKDVQEAYLFIGCVGPDYNHPDQFAMDVLTETLGRGVNPLLNLALRSRRDLVQNLNMTYVPGRFGGAVVVSLRLDPKNVPAAARETVNYLRRCRGENFSRDDIAGDAKYDAFDFLGSAKNQIRFSAEQAEESGLALASSLARFILENERENPGRFLDHIANTTSGDLRKAAAAYLSRGEYVTVAIVPKKTDKSAKED
ncbi:MAG: M16 family metallopeptidase [Candidatus Aminicenantales bacterium]